VFAAYAQGEIDFQPRIFYRNEWSIAPMLNSNGFGANYRYGQRIDAANKRLFEVDFAYIKDPKEAKSYGWDQYSTSRYVDGKKNVVLNFRLGYGRQNEMFRKHDVGGIAVRYFYNFGPSIALLKPILYNVAEWIPNPNLPLGGDWHHFPEPEKYDPSWEVRNIRIWSRASFFKGFNNLGVLPGGFGKLGVNFDFARQDNHVSALEAGVIVEGFVKRLEIMDFTYAHPQPRKIPKNQQFFFTLFVSYRFGRIVDPYEVKKKRERSREISY